MTDAHAPAVPPPATAFAVDGAVRARETEAAA
jgi:hypothetical protein